MRSRSLILAALGLLCIVLMLMTSVFEIYTPSGYEDGASNSASKGVSASRPCSASDGTSGPSLPCNCSQDRPVTWKEFVDVLNGFTRPVRLLQFGANDGIENDPWYRPATRADPKWECVLLEPIPWLYDELVKNRAREGTTLVNAGISGKTQEQTWWTFPNKTAFDNFIAKGGGKWLAQTASENVGQMKQIFKESGKSFANVTVQVLSFADVLKKLPSHWNSEVDLLQVDIEWTTASAMLDWIDFNKFRPRFIYFENEEGMTGLVKMAKIREKLFDAGYYYLLPRSRDEETNQLAVRYRP